VIHFRHVTKELFSSVTLFLLGKPTARNDLKLRLAYRAPPDDRQVALVAFFGNVIEPHEHAGDFKE